MREFLSSPSFYLGLAILNGFAGMNALMSGNIFWVGLSGFFMALCLNSYWRALK